MFESKDLDKHKGKYYGLYRGYVYDNKDPEHMGRIRLCCPSALGIDDETDEPIVSDWAYPKFPVAGNGWGINLVPPIKNPDGSKVMVWVEFEQGDIDYPVWSGCPISENGLQKDANTGQSKINNGSAKTVFSISTPNGIKIVLDDHSGKVTISDKNDNKITMDGKTIDVSNGSTSSLNMNDKQVTLTSGTASMALGEDCIINGNITINGTLNVKQSITGESDINIQGNSNFNGNVTISGDLDTTQNIKADGNISAGGTVHGSNI